VSFKFAFKTVNVLGRTNFWRQSSTHVDLRTQRVSRRLCFGGHKFLPTKKLLTKLIMRYYSKKCYYMAQEGMNTVGFTIIIYWIVSLQRHRRSQGDAEGACAPPVANVQVSPEYCSSLTDKTFNTQKPPRSQIWVRKNCESTDTYSVLQL
jgi:hypothetical protein